MAHLTYRGLPELAGVCRMDEAMARGLSVEQCVARLKRYHYAFKRLHHLMTARITAEPIYELKLAFSHHAYLCAEHVSAIQKRVGEMREPPLGLEKVPSEKLEIFFDEILGAPTTEELVLGIYEIALPELRSAIQRHITDTNLLVDNPTARVCKFALLELDEMIQFGCRAVAALVTDGARDEMQHWLRLLHGCLAADGSLSGAGECRDLAIERVYSRKPYEYDGVPKRDERFADPYNAGVNPESFLYNERMPARAKTLMIYYKRLREIDVPEMMASIITQTPGKPWDYYLDMSRQLWDEARHAMMGEVGFVSLGIDWRRIPINFTWSLNLNTQLEPWQRHAVLYFIEQGLMSKTGKRYEWEVGRASGDHLAALFQDYDWADEVLHAALGREWYVSQFRDAREAMEYGDRCWSQILSQWRAYLDRGLTQHRNWWPEIYQQACRRWGMEPDAAALAFAETYEQVRADLKEISASA
jgi:hypothetical protein